MSMDTGYVCAWINESEWNFGRVMDETNLPSKKIRQWIKEGKFPPPMVTYYEKNELNKKTGDMEYVTKPKERWNPEEVTRWKIKFFQTADPQPQDEW